MLAAVAGLAGAGLATTGLAVAAPAAAGSAPAARAAGILAWPTARPAGILAPPAQLDGVFCVSPANCWAAGEIQLANGARVNQMLHWTGKAWSAVSVPNPGGTGPEAVNLLFAVRCTSAADCWAVGEYDNSASAELNEALHWNGKKWSITSVPSPGGLLNGDFSVLGDLACTSPVNCWAVGTYGASKPAIELNQVLHWNGHVWLQTQTPNPGGTADGDSNAVSSVRCPSPSDCWAGGADGTFGVSGSVSNELLHFTGKKWTTAAVPNPGGVKPGHINEIESLSCISTTSCVYLGRELLGRRLADQGGRQRREAEPGASLDRRKLVRGVRAEPRRNESRQPQRAARRMVHLRDELLGRRGVPRVRTRLGRRQSGCWAGGLEGVNPRRDRALDRQALVHRQGTGCSGPVTRASSETLLSTFEPLLHKTRISMQGDLDTAKRLDRENIARS
jgi:hypothetical protein